MRSAFLLTEKSGLKHPFKNEKAGRAWFEGFLSRNPQLSIHQAQSLSVARATSANKETITDFFGNLGSLYAKLNINAIICKDADTDWTRWASIKAPKSSRRGIVCV